MSVVRSLWFRPVCWFRVTCGREKHKAGQSPWPRLQGPRPRPGSVLEARKGRGVTSAQSGCGVLHRNAKSSGTKKPWAVGSLVWPRKLRGGQAWLPSGHLRMTTFMYTRLGLLSQKTFVYDTHRLRGQLTSLYRLNVQSHSKTPYWKHPEKYLTNI